RSGAKSVQEINEDLRAKLAELEALLRDFARFEVGENGQDAWQDLLSQSSRLLSASAEPSAPVAHA
ncbi:hypothetical protein, partial [Pseudomonas guariconensis]|uniref:hypothetical protein n=1 Tax=Pseudomonas guariconensis TaxID=1288410 RepID=UPI001E54875C